eukprot:gene11247-biopygen8727
MHGAAHRSAPARLDCSSLQCTAGHCTAPHRIAPYLLDFKCSALHLPVTDAQDHMGVGGCGTLCRCRHDYTNRRPLPVSRNGYTGRFRSGSRQFEQSCRFTAMRFPQRVDCWSDFSLGIVERGHVGAGMDLVPEMRVQGYSSSEGIRCKGMMPEHRCAAGFKCR